MYPPSSLLLGKQCPGEGHGTYKKLYASPLGKREEREEGFVNIALCILTYSFLSPHDRLLIRMRACRLGKVTSLSQPHGWLSHYPTLSLNTRHQISMAQFFCPIYWNIIDIGVQHNDLIEGYSNERWLSKLVNIHHLLQLRIIYHPCDKNV